LIIDRKKKEIKEGANLFFFLYSIYHTAPISSSDRPIPTYPEFSPKPPTSSTAPPPTSDGSKSLLVPGVAIGVAMVTVIVQLFFLSRMGAALFRK
jgi:hypothetical protein